MVVPECIGNPEGAGPSREEGGGGGGDEAGGRV